MLIEDRCCANCNRSKKTKEGLVCAKVGDFPVLNLAVCKGWEPNEN